MLAHQIVCDWMFPCYADSRPATGACQAFDRQLMARGALRGDISENPQVSLPLFPSYPLTAPIKLHTHQPVFPLAL